MKKIISLSLVLMLLLGILAVPALAEEKQTAKIGVLAMLNVDEAKMKDILTARKILMTMAREQSNVTSTKPVSETEREMEPVFYDSLDHMLMALNAGDIERMEIYKTTAGYLCANNSELTYGNHDQLDKSTKAADLLFRGILANDFSFLLMEDQEALREELNAAIAAIKEDGTMEKLTAEYIDGVIGGKEIVPIEIVKIDGADTIRLGITGDLPPMDYIAPDGTPAGFNTALMAEISKRIGKNIELVQMASAARSSALASGTVDVVFWTRTSSFAKQFISDSEGKEPKSEIIKEALDLIKPEEFMTADIPERTISTDPYFSDELVIVSKKD
jgi:ABC-type amino acid transport substrate-binding protein